VTDGDTDARSLSQDAQEVLRVRAVKMLEEGLTQVEVADPRRSRPSGSEAGVARRI
jgi:hypothetical protein